MTPFERGYYRTMKLAGFMQRAKNIFDLGHLEDVAKTYAEGLEGAKDWQRRLRAMDPDTLLGSGGVSYRAGEGLGDAAVQVSDLRNLEESARAVAQQARHDRNVAAAGVLGTGLGVGLGAGGLHAYNEANKPWYA